MGTNEGFRESDYVEIEKALRESARGRQFLERFAARARAEDTGRLMDAIGKLDASLKSDPNAPHLAGMGGVLDEIGTALDDVLGALTRAIRTSGMQPEDMEIVTGARSFDPDPLTPMLPNMASPGATYAILEAAEDIQSFLHSLRARAVRHRFHEKVESRLIEIQEACATIDRGWYAAAAVAALLRELKTRIAGMREAASQYEDAEETPGERTAGQLVVLYQRNGAKAERRGASGATIGALEIREQLVRELSAALEDADESEPEPQTFAKSRPDSSQA